MLLSTNLFAAPWLTFTEIHYFPGEQNGTTGAEFIEILNREPPSIDLSGWKITGEVDYTFPPGTSLEPGKRLVITDDPNGLLVLNPHLDKAYGPYEGKLDNSGGKLTLRRPNGVAMAWARYDSGNRWTSIPKGTGHSLCLVDPGLDPNEPENWAASPFRLGSPGEGNGYRGERPGILTSEKTAEPFLRRFKDPKINEVLFDPDEPLNVKSIELYNPGAEPFPIGGFFITKNRNLKGLTPIPAGTIIPPQGFLVLQPDQLKGDWTLAPDSDELIILVKPDEDTVQDALEIKALEEVEQDFASVARYPDGQGRTVTLKEATPKAANTFEIETPLVINEILYNPITRNDDHEFIEIYNPNDSEVSLDGYRLRGGIKFDFPEGASIDSKDYLVIARSPTVIKSRYGLKGNSVLGPYSGTLSNRSDVIRILDDRGLPIDSVRYSDDSPWSSWADGMGASLELIHPSLDNSLATAWGASDDSKDSDWQPVKYVKKLKIHPTFRGSDNGEREFQVMLLDEGVCLIDDLQVQNRRKLIRDSGFTQRTPDDWIARGSHSKSDYFKSKSAKGGSCYKIESEGRGTSKGNYVGVRIPAKAFPENQSHRISFRAKWIRGSTSILTRVVGQGLAEQFDLKPPVKIGTPGMKNSIYEDKPAPAIGDLHQFPISPQEGKTVEIHARVSSPSELKGVWLNYDSNDNGSWKRIEMNPVDSESSKARGEGTLYRGVIPDNDSGKVAYYITSQEEQQRLASFPLKAPKRVCQYQVDTELSSRHPQYSILATRQEWQEYGGQRNNKMSNKLFDATLVYGNSRIFHNVRFRDRGSSFSRPNRNYRIQFGAKRLDGRSTLTLDGQHKDSTFIAERLTYWLMDLVDLPTPRSQYIHLSFNGRGGSRLFEDVEKIDTNYLQRWYEPLFKKGKDASSNVTMPTQGLLYKVDDYFELPSHNNRKWDQATFAFKGMDPEEYRWNFPLRSNSFVENYQPLVKLIQFMDIRSTPDAVFFKNQNDIIDVDQWIRQFAVRAVVNDWDAFGRERGKNAFLYLPPGEGKWKLLPWDADLAWNRGETSPLIMTTFPAVNRFLSKGKNNRLYKGYISHLIENVLTEEHLGKVIQEIKDFRGSFDASRRERFMERRKAHIKNQLQNIPLRLSSPRRVNGRGNPDTIVITGSLPLNVHRFALDQREGTVEIDSSGKFRCSFPVGPEGGEKTLTVMGYGGRELASRPLKVPSRSGAIELASLSPVGKVLTASEVDRPELVLDGSDQNADVNDPVEDPDEGNQPTPVVIVDDSNNDSTDSTDTTHTTDTEDNTEKPTENIEAVSIGGPDDVGSALAERNSELNERNSSQRRNPVRSNETENSSRSGSVRQSTKITRRRPPPTPIQTEPSEEEEGGGFPGWILWVGGLVVVLIIAQLVILQSFKAKREREMTEAAFKKKNKEKYPSRKGSTLREPERSGEVELEMPDDPIESSAASSAYDIDPSLADFQSVDDDDDPLTPIPNIDPEPIKTAPPIVQPKVQDQPEPKPVKKVADQSQVKKKPQPQAQEKPKPAPQPNNKVIQALANPNFEKATWAFQRLWKSSGRSIPDLIEALNAKIPSAIMKIKKGSKGLRFLPLEEGQKGIPVKRLASLILENLIGKPPEDYPTKQDWERHWKSKKNPS